MRGANFIRNCARSVSSSSGILNDGSFEVDDESAAAAAAGTALLAVNVATTSVLDFKYCTKKRVVWAHRSNDAT
jgi:hypothetical protein